MALQLTFPVSPLASLMRCYMDQTVDPCDRFFDYACGRWSHHHPIPTDKVLGLGPLT